MKDTLAYLSFEGKHAVTEYTKMVRMKPTIHKKLKLLAGLTDRDLTDVVEIAAERYISHNYSSNRHFARVVDNVFEKNN